jgi:hypothetical protein
VEGDEYLETACYVINKPVVIYFSDIQPLYDYRARVTIACNPVGKKSNTRISRDHGLIDERPSL